MCGGRGEDPECGAVGDLVSLLVTVKGLPGGFNRDLREDRGPLLESGRRARAALRLLTVALPRIHFEVDRCRRALATDATQATDLAEALVLRGVPFRTAYQKVGALVRKCQDAQVTLEQVTVAFAQEVDAAFDAEFLQVAKVDGSVARKQSAGGTGPASIDAQLEALKAWAREAQTAAKAVPRLSALFESLVEAAL